MSTPSFSETYKRLRRAGGRFGPVRSTWHLLHALRMAVQDGSEPNRRRVDREFASPDPWNYATSRLEQECFRHQTSVLDRARGEQLFGEAWEIGCAEGFFTEALADRCKSVLAVDLSPMALARARQRRAWGDHVRFAHWDLRTDPLPGTFDLIVAAGVLEYLYRPAALRAARKVLVNGLRPGGLLFLVSTRNQIVERAWWGRMLRGGARINEYVALHSALRTVTAEEADWYVITLLERTP